MDDRTRIALGIGLGALAGGLAGFLLFTERGRQLRESFEPRLEELMAEFQRLGVAFDRTRRAVNDGLGQFTQAAESAGQEFRSH